jgi:hypothetical protein
LGKNMFDLEVMTPEKALFGDHNNNKEIHPSL